MSKTLNPEHNHREKARITSLDLKLQTEAIDYGVLTRVLVQDKGCLCDNGAEEDDANDNDDEQEEDEDDDYGEGGVETLLLMMTREDEDTT